jgi:hypothetical protein
VVTSIIKSAERTSAAMRVFRKVDRSGRGGPHYRWIVLLPNRLVDPLGWQHRDDLHAEVVDGEIRLKKLGPRDRRRDLVPGGRYDPVTGALKPLPPA